MKFSISIEAMSGVSGAQAAPDSKTTVRRRGQRAMGKAAEAPEFLSSEAGPA